jgi:phosphate-selective porin OprO/OprP
VTEAGVSDSDIDENRRQWTKFNQYDGPYSTFRWGFGFLTDFVHHEQDAGSKQQFGELEDETGVRDFRLLFSGKFKTKREFTWTTGIMYDGADKQWHARQTGFQIGIPEMHSRVFLGRTKEGYSMIKVMIGYYGWTIERSPALDAFVPILGDGVKWMYWHPEHHTFFSLGYFMDALSNRETFSTAHNVVTGRFGLQPILSDENKEVLHVAVMGRYFEPENDSLKIRSRPESYLSPFFLDAGTIKSDRATDAGFEVYYRKHSWLVGGEYNWQQVDALNGDKPLFHAGDVVATWILTGETRPYNAPGAFFSLVSPEKSVFKGGWGAWEAVLHYSYSDFDSLTYKGGKFWRITPMMNWYLNDQIRLEFVYGYGKLDRFDVTGATQFFQARIQFAL